MKILRKSGKISIYKWKCIYECYTVVLYSWGLISFCDHTLLCDICHSIFCICCTHSCQLVDSEFFSYILWWNPLTASLAIEWLVSNLVLSTVCSPWPFKPSWFNWWYRSKFLSWKQCYAKHCGLVTHLSSFDRWNNFIFIYLLGYFKSNW
jgi:hypothetical protein